MSGLGEVEQVQEETSVARIDRLFGEFVAATDRGDLAIDDEGEAQIAIGDDVIVNFFADAEAETALAVATVGAVDGEALSAADVYLKLLKLHAYERGTRGFTIGLESEESGRIVIADRRPFADFENWEQLGAWFGACAMTARELREQLGEGGEYGRN